MTEKDFNSVCFGAERFGFFRSIVPLFVAIFFEPKKNRLKKGFPLLSGLKENILLSYDHLKKEKQ